MTSKVPCIRLARGKFELTDQDLAGGKNSSVLTSSWNQATFVTGDVIKYPRKGIYNFKNQTSWQKVKNMNHFVFLSFYFGAKNKSPAPWMATAKKKSVIESFRYNTKILTADRTAGSAAVSKVQPPADYWTINRESLETTLCYLSKSEMAASRFTSLGQENVLNE